MKKHLLLRILGLLVVACVLADQLVEPAFSTSLAPGNRLRAVPPLTPMYDSFGGDLPTARPVQPVKRPTLNAWVADFSHRQAMSALRMNSSQFDEISLFAVGADMQGHLAPETEFIRLALAVLNKQPHRPRVLLTVANNRPRRVQDRWLIRQWLGNGDKWTQHAHDLLEIAGPVDGLDIDYENLRPADVAAYSQFLMYLAYRLHARGKFLTVTVEAQSFLTAGFDWKTLSESVDRVRIMAYPYHYERTNPGAVSPPDIVKKLAQQALQVVPATKLEIGLPNFGYDWSAKGRGKVIAMAAHYDRLVHQPGARQFRDLKTCSARVDYTQGRIHHHVWFEDSMSVAYKVHLLQSLGIQHIGLWQVGAGDMSPLFDLMNPRLFREALSALPGAGRFDRILTESPQDSFLSNDLI